jgi:hypothetical protein
MPNCPGCGRGAAGPPLKTQCDLCQCAFCANGNCTGTIGGSSLVRTGSGRSSGSTCPKCGKGKLKRV